MLTQRQALEEARGNIAAGTTIAARLKESSQNPEIRELAKAVHYIGFGSQQIVNAFTDSGRVRISRRNLQTASICPRQATRSVLAEMESKSASPTTERTRSGFRIALRRRSWEAWNKPSRRSSSAGISLSCNSLIMDLSHLHVPKPDRFIIYPIA